MQVTNVCIMPYILIAYKNISWRLKSLRVVVSVSSRNEGNVTFQIILFVNSTVNNVLNGQQHSYRKCCCKSYPYKNVPNKSWNLSPSKIILLFTIKLTWVAYLLLAFKAEKLHLSLALSPLHFTTYNIVGCCKWIMMISYVDNYLSFKSIILL